MEALWIISPALPFRPLGNKFSEPDALESDSLHATAGAFPRLIKPVAREPLTQLGVAQRAF
jgi:hypothetical protein